MKKISKILFLVSLLTAGAVFVFGERSRSCDRGYGVGDIYFPCEGGSGACCG